MAIGRQDYQGGVVPIKSGYSLAQSNFFKWEYFSIVTLMSHEFCNYTVAAGYRLNVCGYRVMAARPFIHSLSLYVGGVIVFFRYWDTEVNDNFPEGVTLTVEAGEEIYVVTSNLDSISAWMDVSIYGYLEQILS